MRSKFVIFIILIIIIAGAILEVKILLGDLSNKKEDVLAAEEIPTPTPTPTPTPKIVQIYKGDDRPIAVMIDNHDDARPQVSINDAYVVYEIIVEGGVTRMMPIFKGKDLEEIGPIRSARHYFIDYALENDAIYVHFGQSPQAENDLRVLGVAEIEGIYYSNGDFWRTKGKYAPHNVLTSTQNILNIAERKNYRTTSDAESVLKYIPDDDANLVDGQDAIIVNAKFSYLEKVRFEYDEERNAYVKYANNKKQTDWRSEEDITFKNVIICFIENYTLNDPEQKGRQGLNNLVEADGYYITNGKAIQIKCTKEERESQTIYTDLNGEEIQVSDGNTYIGILPLGAEVTIEGPELPEEEEE